MHIACRSVGTFEFGTGPAKGGKLLYIWSILAESPYGNPIIGDAMTWVLGKALQ